MRAQVMGGAFWNLLATLAHGAVGLAVKLILARLLFPEHFGLIGMTVVFTGFVSTINELGLTAALIQRRSEDLRDVHFDVAFWTTLGSSVLAFALMVVVVGPFAARFYGEPLLAPLTTVLSVPLLLRPLTLVHRARLLRELDFRALAVVDVAAAAAAGGGAIGLALAGAGVWSIACQSVIAALVPIFLIRRFCAWSPGPRFSARAFREIAGFGLYVTGNGVFGFLAANIDSLLIGKLLGAEALGAYTLAFMLIDVLRTKVINIMDRVLYPAYSRLQDDPARLKRYYLTSIRYSALAVFPVMVVLALLGGPLLPMALGEKWSEAALPLRILAVSAMIFCLGGTSASVLRSIGKPGLHFRIFVTKTVVITVPALVAGIHLGGIDGAAIAVVVHMAAGRIIFQQYLNRLIGVREGEILRAVGPAMAGGLVITGIVHAQRLLFGPPGSLPGYITLATVALAAYGLVVAGGIMRADLRVVWNDLRPRATSRP